MTDVAEFELRVDTAFVRQQRNLLLPLSKFLVSFRSPFGE